MELYLNQGLPCKRQLFFKIELKNLKFDVKIKMKGGEFEMLTEELEELLKDVDVVLPKKRNYYIENLYSHYKHTTYVEPLDETGKIIKEKYPDIAVRSTFIVGYPTETNAEFKKLCNFIKSVKFDYAGFFPYYREENTASFYLKKQHFETVKKKRFKKITKIQNAIVYEKAKTLLGQTFKTLVDYFDNSTGVYIGHTEFLSPTVDFEVQIVDNGNIKAGDFVSVKFMSFDGSAFKGEVYEFTK